MPCDNGGEEKRSGGEGLEEDRCQEVATEGDRGELACASEEDGVEEREGKGSSGRDRETLEESLLSNNNNNAQGSISVYWARDFNDNRGTKPTGNSVSVVMPSLPQSEICRAMRFDSTAGIRNGWAYIP